MKEKRQDTEWGQGQFNTESLVTRNPCKKHSVRVALFIPKRELRIQDDCDANDLKDAVQWVAVYYFSSLKTRIFDSILVFIVSCINLFFQKYL